MNTFVKVVSGCRDLEIPKGARCQILDVKPMGPEYSHMARVLLSVGSRRIALFARHVNRCAEPEFHLNNGNPLKRITVRREA